jgi:hypothetical protein
MRILKESTSTKVSPFAFLYFPRNGSSVDRLTTAITKVCITTGRNTLKVTAGSIKTCVMVNRNRIGDVPKGGCSLAASE